MIGSIAAVTLDTMGICIALLVVKSLQYTQLNSGANGAEALGNTLTLVPASLALLIFCGIFSWFTVGLFGFHLLLVYNGISTNEYIKGHLDKWNAYSKGPAGNFFELIKCSSPGEDKPQPLPPLWQLPQNARENRVIAAEDIHLSN